MHILISRWLKLIQKYFRIEKKNLGKMYKSYDRNRWISCYTKVRPEVVLLEVLWAIASPLIYKII